MTVQQSGKKDSIKDKSKSSANNIYKSSGSQFSRNITGTKSGPKALEKSRSVMILLTILEATKGIMLFQIGSRREST